MPSLRVTELDLAWVGVHHESLALAINRCARIVPCRDWFSGRDLATGLGFLVLMVLSAEQLTDVRGTFWWPDSIRWSSALGIVFVGPESIWCEAILFKRKGLGCCKRNGEIGTHV